MKYEISRDEAKRIDLRQKRERLRGSAMEELIILQACRYTLVRKMDDLKRFSRKFGTSRFIGMAAGLLKHFVDATISHVSVQQICSIQGMTTDSYVNVKTYAGEGFVQVRDNDMLQLISVARGNLHDEHGEHHTCKDCMCCMSRAEYQHCELYQLLGRIPIASPERYDDPNICPYSLGSEWE